MLLLSISIVSFVAALIGFAVIFVLYRENASLKEACYLWEQRAGEQRNLKNRSDLIIEHLHYIFRIYVSKQFFADCSQKKQEDGFGFSNVTNELISEIIDSNPFDLEIDFWEKAQDIMEMDCKIRASNGALKDLLQGDKEEEKENC